MMLRSASTPIFGSLLSSTSSALHFPGDSPSNSHHPPAFSCHFSPVPDGLAGHSPAQGMRRTRSDDNLHSLLSDHHHHNHADDSLPHPPSVKCSASSRRAPPALDTIPSFSAYDSPSVVEEVEQEEEEDNEVDTLSRERVRFHSTSGVKAKDSGAGSATVPPLFLARGLGIDRIASGLLNVGGDDCGNGCGIGGGGGRCDVLAGNGGEQSDVEMYYKKMVEENPTDALFLRNYAQFLYRTKGDLRRAEEYYSRAILADPGDGEILSQYAKVVWELHHDEERATSYFEQSVKAAPQDSHVLAAYAGFLWETEDEGDGGDLPVDFAVGPGALAPATA